MGALGPSAVLDDGQLPRSQFQRVTFASVSGASLCCFQIGAKGVEVSNPRGPRRSEVTNRLGERRLGRRHPDILGAHSIRGRALKNRPNTVALRTLMAAVRTKAAE